MQSPGASLSPLGAERSDWSAHHSAIVKTGAHMSEARFQDAFPTALSDNYDAIARSPETTATRILSQHQPIWHKKCSRQPYWRQILSPSRLLIVAQRETLIA